MLTDLMTKIRALIGDLSKSGVEAFTFSNLAIFTLSECNVSDITKVTKGGVELGSGEWSFDSTTNQLTVTASLSSGDIIQVYYTYVKYSDTELTEYIRASLIWLSIYDFCGGDYELEVDEIIPTPENKTLDLIAIVSSILIKPNYSEYRLPNGLRVTYPRTVDKEKKIELLIQKFNRGLGISGVITWE